MKRKLKEHEGAAYIETLGGFFIACIIVVFIVNVVTALIYMSRLGTFADNVSKIVSREGKYDSEVEAIVNEYQEDSKLGVIDISLNGTEFMPGTKKIQMNDKLKVTVSGTLDISFFTFVGFKIPVKSENVSRSEVYWKS